MKSWEGKSAYLFTKDTEEGVRVRSLRFLDEYVEIEDTSKRARLYPGKYLLLFLFGVFGVLDMADDKTESQFEGFEVIYSYTLKDALEDSILVDLHSFGNIPVYASVYKYIRYATTSLLSKG